MFSTNCYEVAEGFVSGNVDQLDKLLKMTTSVKFLGGVQLAQ